MQRCTLGAHTNHCHGILQQVLLQNADCQVVPTRLGGVQRCDAWLSEAIKEAVCCRKFIRQLYPNKRKATKWKLSSWIFLRHFHAKHFHRTNRHRACSERLSTSGLVGHWQRPRRLHVRSQTVLPSSSPGKIRGTQEERTRRHGEALHNKKNGHQTICDCLQIFRHMFTTNSYSK